VKAIAALLLCCAAPLAAQSESGAFVVTLGRDTTVIEQYRRSGITIEGDMLVRTQRAVVARHYIGTLNANGTMARFEVVNRQAANAQGPVTHIVSTFGDTTTVVITRDSSQQTLRVATPGGGLPFLSYSYALYELIGRRGAITGKDTVLTVAAGQDEATALIVKHPRRDSLTVAFAGDVGPTLFTIDKDGCIQTVDGRFSTEKVVSRRLAKIDFPGLLATFQSRPLGQASPPDSVRATIAGASVAVDYSRPSMRGRTIFGPGTTTPRPVVPWGEVWRTGANFATRLTTSADFVLGGQTIPAGTYTLWTLPTPTGWKLIVNKQTKAPCKTAAECSDPKRANLWGTDYSADSDLVRVDLPVTRLTEPVEQFTMGIDPQGDGGVLWMRWETTRLAIPFSKK
jgi:hypothetical protein